MVPTLLIYLVKLWRDANWTDADIAKFLRKAADQVERGGLWP